MRRVSLLLFLIATVWMLGDHPTSAQQATGDPCPMKLRRGIPEVARAREAKKQRLRDNGVPERYLHLLDKYECVECVQTAPDTVHVTIVYKDEFAPRLSTGAIDNVISVRMLPQVERQVRDDLASGRIESFHVWISEKRCHCCPDPEDKQPEDYDDWNDDLGVNEDQVDSFDDPSDLPPLPEDLKRAPAGWTPPPPLEEFSKPRRRVLQVICDACKPLADQWNSAAGGLDYLWDRKVSLQKQINITGNAIGHRNNEINDLEYQQQFDSSRSYDRMKQIEALKQVNTDQRSDIEREERELAEVEKQIEEQQARMDDIMRKVQECEKTCRKTTAAAPAPVTAAVPRDNQDPVIGGTRAPKRLPLAVEPLNAVVECAECEATARRLRREHARLQQMAERAFVLQSEADYDDAVAQQKVVAGLVEELAACNKRKPCTPAKTDTTSPPATGPTGVTPAVPDWRTTPIPPVAELTLITTSCPECRIVAGSLNQVQRDLARLEAFRAQTEASLEAARADAAAVAAEALPLQERYGFDAPLAQLPGGAPVAARLDAARAKVRTLADAFANSYDGMIELLESFGQLKRELENCERRCLKPATSVPTTSNTVNAPTPSTPEPPTGCVGSACEDTWRECTSAGTCAPIERDCGYPGTCPDASGAPVVQLTDPQLWDVMNAVGDVVKRIQLKVGEFADVAPSEASVNATASMGPQVVIPAMRNPDVRDWFNPLGLLARRITGQVERWRGSAGPRPYITTRDRLAIESHSGSQAAGLQKGVHVLLTDRGGSTGKTLGLQVLNFSGRAVRLSSLPFAIEPLDANAARKAQQAFSRLASFSPRQIDLNGYCLEMLKAPPSPATVYRLAPKEVQQAIAPMSKVLRSAYRIKTAGLLRPDSDPAAYTDSIKQWALWTVEQKFNEARYTDAFIEHTKKNMEGSGQKWSKQAEDIIRKVSPNRWRDIAQVLRGAGVTVPR